MWSRDLHCSPLVGLDCEPEQTPRGYYRVFVEQSSAIWLTRKKFVVRGRHKDQDPRAVRSESSNWLFDTY